jgi:Bacterial PH domain
MGSIRARISGISYSGGLILAGIILLPLHGLGLILLLLAPIWVWYLSKSFELSMDDKSVRFRKGLLSKNVYSMAIRQIESIELRQSLGGRIFNYGALRFRGTGASNDYTPIIKDPEAFKSEVERRMQAAHAPPPQYPPSQYQPPLPPSMGTEGSSPAPAPPPRYRHVTLVNTKSGELKQIKIGFSWILLFFSSFFGLPLFLRRLYIWGGVFLVLFVVYFVASEADSGAAAGICDGVGLINLGLSIWMAIKGNEMTGKNLLANGWDFAEPNSPETQYARLKWRLSH